MPRTSGRRKSPTGGWKFLGRVSVSISVGAFVGAVWLDSCSSLGQAAGDAGALPATAVPSIDGKAETVPNPVAMIPTLPRCDRTGRAGWAPPGLVDRRAWDSHPPAGEFVAHSISAITIHHTAVTWSDAAEAAQRMRGYQRDHQSRGWPDVAYHFVIARDGSVLEGRPTWARGDSATRYELDGKLLIALDGNFELEEPSDAQWLSAEKMIRWGLDRFGVDRRRVTAHASEAATLCPGKRVLERMGRAMPLGPGVVAGVSPEPEGATGAGLGTGTDEPCAMEWPLPHREERAELMAAYLASHQTRAPSGDVPSAAGIVPRVVVIHWTGGGSAAGAWATFETLRLTGRPELLRGGDVNVGAHYLVDRDGTISRLLPEWQAARHAIGLNHVAIGIENVGDGDRFPLTAAQLSADARLVRALARRFPITHLLGHYETMAMKGSSYFEERDLGYATAKHDPGEPFMAALRGDLLDLGLLGPPNSGVGAAGSSNSDGTTTPAGDGRTVPPHAAPRP